MTLTNGSVLYKGLTWLLSRNDGCGSDGGGRNGSGSVAGGVVHVVGVARRVWNSDRTPKTQTPSVDLHLDAYTES